MAFTIEEVTFLNHYKSHTKVNMITEIKKITPFIDDENMQELATAILGKLESISDSDFLALNFGDALQTNEKDSI